jgi:hypothetical protein
VALAAGRGDDAAAHDATDRAAFVNVEDFLRPILNITDRDFNFAISESRRRVSAPRCDGEI